MEGEKKEPDDEKEESQSGKAESEPKKVKTSSKMSLMRSSVTSAGTVKTYSPKTYESKTTMLDGSLIPAYSALNDVKAVYQSQEEMDKPDVERRSRSRSVYDEAGAGAVPSASAVPSAGAVPSAVAVPSAAAMPSAVAMPSAGAITSAGAIASSGAITGAGASAAAIASSGAITGAGAGIGAGTSTVGLVSAGAGAGISGFGGFGNFPCASVFNKRSPYIHNPPTPEIPRARVDHPRSPKDYIINLREDLADFQESRGLPRTRDYTFLTLGLALAQETARTIFSLFLMFAELFPILAVISLILRFALDKIIDILETPEPGPRFKKTVIFCLQMLVILIPLWILIGTIVIPLISLLFSIIRKMFRIRGGKKKSRAKPKPKLKPADTEFSKKNI